MPGAKFQEQIELGNIFWALCVIMKAKESENMWH